MEKSLMELMNQEQYAVRNYNNSLDKIDELTEMLEDMENFHDSYALSDLITKQHNLIENEKICLAEYKEKLLEVRRELKVWFGNLNN